LIDQGHWYGTRVHRPTHWRPLPKPPVAALSQDIHSLPLKPQKAVEPAGSTPPSTPAGTPSEAE
jgi:hypothetical protein